MTAGRYAVATRRLPTACAEASRSPPARSNSFSPTAPQSPATGVPWRWRTCSSTTTPGPAVVTGSVEVRPDGFFVPADPPRLWITTGNPDRLREELPPRCAVAGVGSAELTVYLRAHDDGLHAVGRGRRARLAGRAVHVQPAGRHCRQGPRRAPRARGRPRLHRRSRAGRSAVTYLPAGLHCGQRRGARRVRRLRAGQDRLRARPAPPPLPRGDAAPAVLHAAAGGLMQRRATAAVSSAASAGSRPRRWSDRSRIATRSPATPTTRRSTPAS